VPRSSRPGALFAQLTLKSDVAVSTETDPSKPAPDYTRQRSQLTLREALGEYYDSNPQLADPSGMPDGAATLFRQHDAGHVVFGCDTSLAGEVRIDSWTIFASTIGMGGYLEYLKYPQVNQIFEEAGYLRIVIASLRCLPDVAKIALRSWQMSKRWPWQDYELFLDRMLCDIRDEYGVRVIE
jgi:hypothetical protein